MTKIGIISGSLYNGNMGVQALTYSLIASLDAIAKRTKNKFEYVVFDNSPVTSSKYEINIRDQNISCETIYFERMGKKLWFRQDIRKEFIPKWKTCDLFFDICGGDSFSDIYGWQRVISACLTHHVLRFLKKPIIMPPQTIGPFRARWVKWLALRTMKKATHVYSRDRISSDYLHRRLPQLPFCEFLDMAFFLPYEPVVQASGQVHVGLNVSGLLWNGGYTRNNQFGLKCDYQEFIVKQIEYFYHQPNVLIHLVPHVITPHAPIEDDVLACQTLARRFPQVKIAPSFKNPIEAKSYIAGLDFFTGSRMHSAIAAFSSGVPVCPIAYSRKFSGLFHRTLNYDALADLTKDNSDKALEQVRCAFLRREELQSKINQIQLFNIELYEKLLDSFRKDIAQT